MAQTLLNVELIKKNQTILVALSGGPDSVFLLHQLHTIAQEYNLKLIAAHLNHEWRGKDSDQDEEFCKTLCETLQIPFYSKRLSQLSGLPAYNGSKENYARQARKLFLHEIATQESADAIATAHHQDDHIETFFIRLIRGASLAGLIGIKAQQKLYIRPLLLRTKAEILEYLDQNNLTFTLDASNNSDDFLRNRIRKHLIPTINQIDNRAQKNIINFMNHAQQTEAYLEKRTQDSINLIKTQTGYCVSQFLSHELYMQKRIMLHLLIAHKIQATFQETFIQECIRFLKNSKAKRHTIATSWALIKSRDSFNFEEIL